MLILALLLPAAVVGLEIEDTANLPLARAVEIASSLGRVIEAETGDRFIVQDPVWTEKAPADERVRLRIYGGLTQIRVRAERGEVLAEMDLELDAASWPDATHALFHQIFPRVTHQEPLVVAATPSKPMQISPLIAAATTVAALAVGIGFGVSAKSARSAVETEPHDEATIARLSGQSFDHGLAANILFGVAGAAVLFAGGALYFELP